MCIHTETSCLCQSGAVALSQHPISPELLPDFELWLHFHGYSRVKKQRSHTPSALHLIFSNLTSHSSALKFHFVWFETHYLQTLNLAVSGCAGISWFTVVLLLCSSSQPLFLMKPHKSRQLMSFCRCKAHTHTHPTSSSLEVLLELLCSVTITACHWVVCVVQLGTVGVS